MRLVRAPSSRCWTLTRKRCNTRATLDSLKSRHGRTTHLQFVRKSVQNILKESARTIERPAQDQFDLIYCAGLFDYLSDAVCQRLSNILYDWLAPDGLLVVTNVA